MKILLVSYLFPPVGGGGVQRISILAKFLSDQNNVDVSVYTEQKAKYNYDVYDYTLKVSDKIKVYSNKGIEIHRTVFSTKDNNNNNNSLISKQNSFTKRIVNRLSQLFIRIFQPFLPDEKIGFIMRSIHWIFFRRVSADIVIGSVRPPSNAVIAMIYSIITGSKLIIEYRDLWFGQEFQNKRFLYEKVNRLYEYFVLNKSSFIVCVSPSYIRILSKRYPKFKDKFVLITNGFPKEYLDLKPKDEIVKNYENQNLVIAHFGRFYGPRKIDELIQELQKVDIGFEFWHFGPEIDNSETDLTLFTYFKNKGYITFNESWKIQQSSDIDILLLIEYTSDNIPGKVFEYYASNKPILIICPANSILREIFKTADGFFFIENKEIADIVKMIKTIKENISSGKRIERDMNLFMREKIYSKYFELLINVLNNKNKI